jgi:hypothetical protein
MSNLSEALTEACGALDNWHEQDLTWFDYDQEETSSIQSFCRRLAFHNYCNWHFTDAYNAEDHNYVKFVWDGGLAHNNKRNLLMQDIDEYFVSIQTENGDYNSEGMGSIIDRFTNDYLKYIHFKSDDDERAPLLIPQIEFLKSAALNLERDLLSGQKRIIIFKKFKTKSYVKLCEQRKQS